MTFLKKLGQIVLKATEIAIGVGPLLSGALPKSAGTVQTITQELQLLAGVVVQVEVMGAALDIPGADKLKAAAPAVAQIILQSSLLAGRKVANPELFLQGSTKVADGMADVLNSLKADVETVKMTD